MRTRLAALGLLLAMAAVMPAHAQSPEPVGHSALHLAVHDFGLSIGNAPRVYGLRLNWQDRGLERVIGANITVLADENPRSSISGLAVNVLGGAYPRGLQDFGAPTKPWVSAIHGLALSPFSIAVERSNGILVTGIAGLAEHAIGIHVGGLGLGIGDGTGIHVGGLAVFGDRRLNGLTAAGIAAVASGSMTGINAAGVVKASFLSGINLGGILVAPSVRGLSIAAFVIADSVSGVSGITTAGVIGQPPWLTMNPEVPDVRGISAAAIVEAHDLTGFSVAGYHRVAGVQRGVTIGLFNDARILNGVQLGVLNIARNNAGVFRSLPVVNAHFGR